MVPADDPEYIMYVTVLNDWSINEGISTGQNMSFAQGFSYSSNVGMTILEQEMGDKVWSNYLSLYKFGLPTALVW